MADLDAADRRRLRSALSAAVPWLTRPDVGPRAVDAGQCDRCGVRPRFVPTCGPAEWRALCRDCVLEVGTETAWCVGHVEDGREVVVWLAGLPAWWGDATVLWWVATGEVDAVPPSVAAGLPETLRATLPPSATPLT